MEMPQQNFARIEDRAEAIVRKLDLPPCPEVLADIAREIRRDVPDVRKIANLVTRDVASAAAMLKTVNSACYGIGAPARSVQQAIAYLGLDRTALLLAGLLLRNAFPRSHRPAMVRFWRTSTQLALSVAFLARVLGLHDPDEAHTFGLFRDAGSAVLICKHEGYEQATAGAQDGPASWITELEKTRFGIDHAVIGAVLARDWLLPESMSDAILWHHADFVLDMPQPPIAEEAVRLIALGMLSDRVLDRYAGMRPNPQGTRGLGEALRVLGLTELQYADLQLEAMTMLEEIDGRPMRTMRLRNILN